MEVIIVRISEHGVKTQRMHILSGIENPLRHALSNQANGRRTLPVERTVLNKEVVVIRQEHCIGRILIAKPVGPRGVQNRIAHAKQAVLSRYCIRPAGPDHAPVQIIIGTLQILHPGVPAASDHRALEQVGLRLEESNAGLSAVANQRIAEGAGEAAIEIHPDIRILHNDVGYGDISGTVEHNAVCGFIGRIATVKYREPVRCAGDLHSGRGHP